LVTRREGDQVDSLLFRLARQVTARQDLDDVLSETLRCLRPLLAFSGGSIQLLDDDGWIQMAASDPIAPEHVMAQRVPLGTSVAGRVILTEQPVYLPDLNVGQVSGGPSKRVSNGVRSYYAVPLVADGRAIGVLQIDSCKVDAWGEDDRSLFLSIASVVAAAIQSARAYARAAAARARAEAAESRLVAARTLVEAARGCSRAGDQRDLDRHLERLQRVLAAAADPAVESADLVRLPDQRLATQRN
jgi:phosphoserine phosphatase RsbU/P